MKSDTKLMLTTLAVAAAGAFVTIPAHADGHHTEQLNAQFVPSSVTRAQVRAELLAAQREGRWLQGEREIERALGQAFVSIRSRAEVRAEAAEANRHGLLAPRLARLDRDLQLASH